MFIKPSPTRILALVTGLVVLGVAGCSKTETPAPQATSEPGAETSTLAQNEADRTADLAAREAELAQREADIALKERERELARREAELTAKESAAKKAAVRPAVPRPVKAPAQVATAPSGASPVSTPRVAQAIVVPAGTQLSVALVSALSTKTAVVGQAFDARLASDVMVGGRRALDAGSRVTGAVTEVVSGSRKIGGVPTLGLRFDSVALEDGRTVAISGKLVQTAKSDTAQDTAKIVGGTAVGAVIGHQIDDDNRGKIIGGILGGAAGALIARNTGSDVELPAESILGIALDAPIELGGK
ncbi:MAG: glycine zipper 2TM domain-containing protein [Steroidobacteraceae bacterium]